MQWKIARPGRLSDAFNRWAIRRGFPALAWIAPRAPRWFLFAGARLVIGVVMALHRKPRRAIARNLSRVLSAPESSPAVRGASRRMIHHLAYYWVDLFRFAQLPAERTQEQLTERSFDALRPLQEAHATGERTILITAHLGNWELGAVLAAQAGLPVSVLYVPDEFGDAERFRSLLRGFGGVEEIPIRPEERFASLPVLRAFGEGRLVALQGDRDFNDRGLEMPFFGAPVRFPPGPFHLARMTGARLWPVFIAYAEGSRFEIELGTPISVARSEDRERDVREAIAAWAEVLERAIRRWPDQWYTFFDYWPEPAEETG